MQWIKKSLIYNAHEYQLPWAINSALTPTPILLNPDVIRVYFGARDNTGVSRIRFVDLNAHNPNEILAIANQPALDVGREGAFDDSGIILGDVVKIKESYYMFYVGFQKVEKVKFLAFTGLAISTDGGHHFERASETPILDRADEGLFIRAIHTALHEDGVWKIWYASGNQWTLIDNVPYPNYYIKYMESEDLFSLPKQGKTAIECQNDEYRIGRPRIYKNNNQFRMYYTKGETNRSYFPGTATSPDGLHWQRQDHELGITLSPSGWDSETLCYPSLITVPQGKTYMFYNGNSMGKDGFGFAELAE